MFQGQGRLGTDGDAVAAPDAAGQSPVQDIHRPVGVASEDALRAYADAAPAPDAMILVEFKRNQGSPLEAFRKEHRFPAASRLLCPERTLLRPLFRFPPEGFAPIKKRTGEEGRKGRGAAPKQYPSL